MADKIRVKNVAKSFGTSRGALPVLEGIDFAVGDGDFVALVGPSGCGKTTLLNIIAGFERPDEGEVSIDGIPVTGPSPRGIVISQLGSVFPWLTVRQNVMFGLRGQPIAERRRLADHYAHLVGLEGFENAYPHELSGGMLKRVEVARALAPRPEILYMDEPLAALDALTRFRMRLELRRILAQERPTCLLVTHDVEEAIHLADRILILSARPARIEGIVDVPFPHPRKLSSPEAVQLKEDILRTLGA
ncbi:MAG: ABC transporter ATP-binding protein [Candidatus Rokubacteria bacterium]|nr:ABC transporter ATP-binding protein [Candidatus Rokubacteria bacterium]